MKSCLIVASLSFLCLAYSIPVQNGMIFYQMPPQQAMLVHYAQHPHHSRSASGSGVSAFAAGETVATGSYLKGNNQQQTPETKSSDDDEVVSIAEAYPEEPPQEGVQIYNADAKQIQEDKVNEVVPETPATQNKNLPAEITATNEANSVSPTTQGAVPAVKTARKKKVFVELDPVADEENDEDEYFVARPRKTSRNEDLLPPETYFPVNFGRTAGGAVAVANSYSAGKAGARSHAVAYGSPLTRERNIPHVEN